MILFGITPLEKYSIVFGVKVHQACNLIVVVSLWVCCLINVCIEVTITSCSVCSVWRIIQYMYSVSPKNPPWGFLTFFPNGWEILVHYTFLSTLEYKFLFNYLQLWLSYAILSPTTQFPSYAQCPPSAETHAFRCLRKSLTALLIVVCGKSSQICCSALFSSGMVFGFDWSLQNIWSITHHTW